MIDKPLRDTCLDRLGKDELRRLARQWVAALMDDANWLDSLANDPTATADRLSQVIKKCSRMRRQI